MVKIYRKILGDLASHSIPDGIYIAMILFVMGIPVALGYSLYDYRVGVAVFAVFAVIVGLILFYNVRLFGFIVLPIYYILIVDNVFFALVILLITSFLADRANRADFSVKIPKLGLIAILMLTCLNSIARAVDPDKGRFIVQYTFVLPIIVFIIYYNLRPSLSEMKAHFTVIITASAIIGWISMAMYLMSGLERIVFRWGSQNAAGCFFGIILPLTLIDMLDANGNENRAFRIILFLGVLMAMLVTQTRAVLVSSFVAMIYIALKDRRILQVMLPIFIVAAIAVPGLIIYRMAMLLGYGDKPDWSAVGRVQIWTNSLTYIPKYFWLGMGLDSFRHKYLVDFPFAFLHPEHPHNIYLKWLFDLGIFGLTAILVMIIGTLRKSMIAVMSFFIPENDLDRRLLLGLNAGIISGLVASLVDSTLNQTPSAYIIWTIMAFMLVTIERMKGRMPATDRDFQHQISPNSL